MEEVKELDEADDQDEEQVDNLNVEENEEYDFDQNLPPS
jgi:hypothetical protein